MKRDVSPWLSANLGVLALATLPAVLLVGVLLYFTGWAVAFSFTDLELVGRKAVNWSWIGLDNYERLVSRRGFLESLWTTVVFTFFSAIVGQAVIGFLLAMALRGRRGPLRVAVEASIMLGWLLPDIVAAFLWSATASGTGLVNQFVVAPPRLRPSELPQRLRAAGRDPRERLEGHGLVLHPLLGRARLGSA
jgi:multiple sugar transport system permease protein